MNSKEKIYNVTFVSEDHEITKQVYAFNRTDLTYQIMRTKMQEGLLNYKVIKTEEIGVRG